MKKKSGAGAGKKFAGSPALLFCMKKQVNLMSDQICPKLYASIYLTSHLSHLPPSVHILTRYSHPPAKLFLHLSEIYSYLFILGFIVWQKGHTF